jgi:TPR repeat protein
MKFKALLTVVLAILISSSAFATSMKIAPNPYKQPDKAFQYVYNLCVNQNADGGWETYMLGSYYDKGYGTKENIIKAYVWYRMSTEEKYKPSFPVLKALTKQMTSQQLVQAKKAFIKTRDKSVNDELNELKTMNQ